MDICIVNLAFSMGGVERVSIELANAFAENDEKVSLIDFSGKNEFYYNVHDNINILDVIEPRTIKRKIIKGILTQKYKIDKTPLNVMNLYKEQAKHLLKYLQYSHHDVLILCQGGLTALIPEIKKIKPNLKIIAWQHNNYDVYLNKYYKIFSNMYLEGVRQADLLVCLTKADLEKFKKINKKSTYIYNPLTIESNTLSSLNNKNIIFVSRLIMEQKGLDYLIKIGNSLKDGWRIIVAGDGPDRKKFKKMIINNDLGEKIILKGSLNSTELSDLYKSGSIFISTSRWEGFGLVITEAMAFGLPIISFDNDGPREILKNGEYGILINDYNIKELTEEINLLVQDRSRMKTLQNKSLERIKDFRSSEILKKWYFFIENIK